MRFVLVASLISTIAFAQTEKRAVPKPQQLDFTGTRIDGDRVIPVVEFTVVPERPVFKRRIAVRASFANELHQSVEAIR